MAGRRGRYRPASRPAKGDRIDIDPACAAYANEGFVGGQSVYSAVDFFRRVWVSGGDSHVHDLEEGDVQWRRERQLDYKKQEE